jgi:hypothetical protein
MKMQLSVGVHRVRLSHPSGRHIENVVRIERGETRLLTVDLTKAGPVP